MTDNNHQICDRTVEMPVRFALMISRDERAVNAFGALPELRRNEYIRRARSATDNDALRSIVRDIITVG